VSGRWNTGRTRWLASARNAWSGLAYTLGSAALRLAVERGLENVIVEDITAEADVSLRTFGNYFSSKYEAICAIGTDRARRIGATLLARPAGG
jgi:AcrR family transcriptional regulator